MCRGRARTAVECWDGSRIPPSARRCALVDRVATALVRLTPIQGLPVNLERWSDGTGVHICSEPAEVELKT